MKSLIEKYLEYKKEKQRQVTIRKALSQREWIYRRFIYTYDYKIPPLDKIISDLIKASHK